MPFLSSEGGGYSIRPSKALVYYDIAPRKGEARRVGTVDVDVDLDLVVQALLNHFLDELDELVRVDAVQLHLVVDVLDKLADLLREVVLDIGARLVGPVEDLVVELRRVEVVEVVIDADGHFQVVLARKVFLLGLCHHARVLHLPLLELIELDLRILRILIV